MKNIRWKDDRKYKIRRAIAKLVITLVVLAIIYAPVLHIAKNVELYSTTAKYHLQLDVENGNQTAIDYYEQNYVSKGIELF